MRILIVDDTHIMRLIVRDILVKSLKIDKNDCIEVDNGRTAISLYKEEKADMVFLDINLPDISGLEVVKELKKLDSEAKIVMCTSSGDKDDVRECVTAGADDYLVKPVKPERVISAVKKVMGNNFGNTDDDS